MIPLHMIFSFEKLSLFLNPPVDHWTIMPTLNPRRICLCHAGGKIPAYYYFQPVNTNVYILFKKSKPDLIL